MAKSLITNKIGKIMKQYVSYQHRMHIIPIYVVVDVELDRGNGWVEGSLTLTPPLSIHAWTYPTGTGPDRFSNTGPINNGSVGAT